MKRIESFCVNHDKLTPGMYVSRIDGDAITYDVRMVVPNAGVYLENDGIHTFEHLLATWLRNSERADEVTPPTRITSSMSDQWAAVPVSTSSPGTKSPKPVPSNWYRKPASLSKTLKEKFLALVASNVETIWTTACQKQKNMPKISPRHLSAGPKTRWFINCNFGRQCLIRQRETSPLPRFSPKGQNFPFIFICYFSFFC